MAKNNPGGIMPSGTGVKPGDPKRQFAPKPGKYSAGPAEQVRGDTKHADNERAAELLKSFYPDRVRGVAGPKGQP